MSSVHVLQEGAAEPEDNMQESGAAVGAKPSKKLRKFRMKAAS